MDITNEFIDAFKVEPESPEEISLDGLVGVFGSVIKSGQFAISTDIAPEEPRASQLDLIYQDMNPPGTQPWNIDGNLFRTIVIPKKDGNDIDTVMFVFDGIVSARDARLWYRAKWGYEAQPAPAEEEVNVEPERMDNGE